MICTVQQPEWRAYTNQSTNNQRPNVNVWPTCLECHMSRTRIEQTATATEWYNALQGPQPKVFAVYLKSWTEPQSPTLMCNKGPIAVD